jgi:hypothetical protein
MLKGSLAADKNRSRLQCDHAEFAVKAKENHRRRSEAIHSLFRRLGKLPKSAIGCFEIGTGDLDKLVHGRLSIFSRLLTGMSNSTLAVRLHTERDFGLVLLTRLRRLIGEPPWATRCLLLD